MGPSRELLFRLDPVCERFEDALRAPGDPPRLEAYLSGWEGDERAELFRLLLALELDYRRGSNPTPADPTPADYQDRFPEFASYLSGLLEATPTAPPQEPLPPDVVGRYRVLGTLGRGGMGIVLRVHDPDFDRPLAVKLGLRQDPEAERRFLAEARITGQLQHPGIPPAHAVGRLADGRPYFSMKLIEGRTLADLLTTDDVPQPRLLHVFEQVAQTLGYAHSKGVLHRDLKPANVMVGEFGEVQVMDWGLAKTLTARQDADKPPFAEAATAPVGGASPNQTTDHPAADESAGDRTRPGTVLGTLSFMAPEQARGEADAIDARADVFGLGAILCTILTGKPPYVATDLAALWAQARGSDLAGARDRLDACGADGELVALAKACLSPRPADRPADGQAVADGVTAYLTGVQERLQAAQREQAVAAAREAEQRKRRRGWLAAAAVVVLTAVSGLGAVLVVQRRANLDLGRKNEELAASRVKVDNRFDLAVGAIETFHTGVSEDTLLKQDQFKELREKLLTQAAGFYGQLETLLAAETDARSRRSLGAGYFQLGGLTEKIGSKPEALAVHRKALAVRRELAAEPGAAPEKRLDLARSLRAVGILLWTTGDAAGGVKAFEEGRAEAAAVAAEHPTEAARVVLAQCHHGLGILLGRTGKLAEALEEYEHARAIRQALVDAHPASTKFRLELADTYQALGVDLSTTDKTDAALAAYGNARAIRQQLVDENPTVAQYQNDLAQSHYNDGQLYSELGESRKALASYQQCMALRKRVAAAYPAVTSFQRDLAASYNSVGWELAEMKRTKEALELYEQARRIYVALAEAHPGVTVHQIDLGLFHYNIARLLADTGDRGKALASYLESLAVRQKVAAANPTVNQFQQNLAASHNAIGLLHAKERRFPEALAALGEALGIRQKLVDANPGVAAFALDLGESYADRGWAQVRGGRPAEAAGDLRRALRLWADDVGTRFERARVLALLAGLGGDAKAGVPTAEAAASGGQAVGLLREVFKTGELRLGWLKGPDWDALREREDFKKLLAELGKKADT